VIHLVSCGGTPIDGRPLGIVGAARRDRPMGEQSTLKADDRPNTRRAQECAPEVGRNEPKS
jgi:hypothetical protein